MHLALCIDGFTDLNQDWSDGCEYECQPSAEPGEIDWPDAQYQDVDCDGIDGELNAAVFVAPDGIDTGNTQGTIDFPFKTIQKGMDACATEPACLMVLVSKGTYLAQITVMEGVNVYGGYDRAAGWSRQIYGNETIVRWEGNVQGAIRTVIATDITVPTVIDGLVLEASSNAAPGGSSIPVHVFGETSGLVLSNNQIKAGNGGPGVDGSNGSFRSKRRCRICRGESDTIPPAIPTRRS